MADTAVVVDVAHQTTAVNSSGNSSSRLGAGKAGGGRGKHGCCFANSSATGSPFMVSGELFLRSTQKLLFGGSSGSGSGSKDVVGGPRSSSDQYLQEQQPGHATVTAAAAVSSAATDNSSAGLLAGLSRDLRDLLLCHPDLIEESGRPSNPTATTTITPASSKGGDWDGGLPGLASSARVERRLVRRKRVACLEASKTIAGCLVTARLNAVQKAAEGFREECAEGHGQLDTRLRSLVLRFAGVTSAGMAVEDEQTNAEDQHCRRETERLQLAARLASLAATAEHRTRGSVVLRRLPPTHPQHARCLRAATENVRPGFFSRESPYGAVQVLDIYKIENRFLLERFERAAQARGPCKVKGLFCHVPDESLEHVVLYGMGGAGSLMGDCGGDSGDVSGSAASAGWDGDPIDFFWGAPATKVAGGRGGGGAVTTTAAATGGAGATPIGSDGRTKPLEFPRAFSRHSTLEEEHSYVNNNRECDGEEYGVQRHRRPWSPLSAGGMRALASTRQGQGQGQRHHTAGEGLTEDGRHRDAVSGLRFLALCRVMIGSMHVAVESSPTVTARRKGTDGGGGGGGMSSCEYSSPSAAPGPPSATFSLPPPPPGQAEFDSVYFPREEEYRLLNEAFVLPEFLVVHRFVASATPSGPGSRGSNDRGSPLSSAGSSAAAVKSGAGAVSSLVTDGERQHTKACRGISRKEKGSAEKRPTGVRGRERGQQQQPNDSHFHSSGDARGAMSPPLTSAMPQDAAAVVAGIEAAMESPVLPPRTNLVSSRNGEASSMQWEGIATPCSLASSSGCAGGDSAFSLSRGGRGGGWSTSLSFELDGGSCEVGGTNDGSSSDGGRGGRRRERDSGRATRNSIVRGVELEFDRFWQEMQRLRELEKTEVTNTALSNRRSTQPP